MNSPLQAVTDRLGGSASSFSCLQGLHLTEENEMASKKEQRTVEFWLKLMKEQQTLRIKEMEDYLAVNIFDDPTPETDWDAELKKLVQED